MLPYRLLSDAGGRRSARRAVWSKKMRIWSYGRRQGALTGCHGEGVKVLAILLAQQDRDIYGDDRLGVRQGDIVFDCGAHMGVYTRKALSAGAKLVVAVEPTPVLVQKMGTATDFRSPSLLETKHFDERKSDGSPHFLPGPTSTTGC